MAQQSKTLAQAQEELIIMFDSENVYILGGSRRLFGHIMVIGRKPPAYFTIPPPPPPPQALGNKSGRGMP